MTYTQVIRGMALGIVASLAMASSAVAQSASEGNDQLSPTSMLQRASAIVTSIGGVSQSLNDRLSNSSGQGNVVQTLCLDDKASQVATALATARQRLASMNEALGVNNLQRANNELQLLNTVNDAVTRLASEAQRCTAQENNGQQENELQPTLDTNLPGNGQPNDLLLTPNLPQSPSLTAFDQIQWGLKLAALETDCQDPTSEACQQSLNEAAEYLKSTQQTPAELQNNLAKLIQTMGTQIGNGASNNVAGPLTRVFEKVNEVLENSNLNPDQKDNVMNKFTSTTVQIAVKKGLGGTNTGSEARNLGTLLNTVAAKTSNPQTKQTLQTVANSLTNTGTFPANFGGSLPNYASPA